MFKRILIGIKFTGASRKTIQTGVQLAKIHGSALHIVHVLDYTLKRLDKNDPERLRPEAEARDLFERELAPLVKGLDRVEFQCLPGDPALDVCRIAKETGAGLILLGCHQRPDNIPLVRVDYAGSTILEKAPCPVLMVPIFQEAVAPETVA